MEFAYHPVPGKAAILAELDYQGIVTFAINASKDSPVRGTELFQRMMIAFGGDVRGISGVWRKGSGPSINIDRVNELTTTGMPLDEAVRKTWTATRAAKFGFTMARLLRQPEGTAGSYTAIDVLFEKAGE